MAQKEYAFFHFGFEDTGGAQIGGQYPLYDRGHIAEIYDANFRSRVANSGKASLIQLFDPGSPGEIGGDAPAAATFTTLTASGDLAVGTDALFVDVSADCVGIGTAVPKTHLHVVQGSAGISNGDVSDERSGTIFLDGSAVTRADGVLASGIAFSGAGSTRRRALIASYQDGADGDPTGLKFYTYSGAGTADDALVERLVLTSGGDFHVLNGNVGIGTTSPDTSLHVNSGAGNTTAIFESTDTNAYIELRDDTTSAGFQVAVGAQGNTLRLVGGGVVGFQLIDGGLVGAGATGGDKGTGTINATAVYDDNTLLTDLVLDLAVDGAWNRDAYAAHPLDPLLADHPEWLIPSRYAAYWREHRHLPGMISWMDEDDRPSTGEIVTRQTAALEMHAVHIANINDRLTALEARRA